jgi:hypothetical protein
VCARPQPAQSHCRRLERRAQSRASRSPGAVAQRRGSRCWARREAILASALRRRARASASHQAGARRTPRRFQKAARAGARRTLRAKAVGSARRTTHTSGRAPAGCASLPCGGQAWWRALAPARRAARLQQSAAGRAPVAGASGTASRRPLAQAAERKTPVCSPAGGVGTRSASARKAARPRRASRDKVPQARRAAPPHRASRRYPVQAAWADRGSRTPFLDAAPNSLFGVPVACL